MQNKAEQANRIEKLNVAALSSAIVLTLTIGAFTWALGEFVWPGLARAIRLMVVEEGFLVNAFVVTGILAGKEFIVRNRTLTFGINALAALTSVVYFALYLSTNIMGLVACARFGAATG